MLAYGTFCHGSSVCLSIYDILEHSSIDRNIDIQCELATVTDTVSDTLCRSIVRCVSIVSVTWVPLAWSRDSAFMLDLTSVQSFTIF